MKIEEKRKCKGIKLSSIEFGTVFKDSCGDYFISTNDSCVNESMETIFCTRLSDGELIQFCIEDEFEVVKAKVVIE